MLSILAVAVGVMLLTATSVYTSSIQYSKQVSYEEANMADFVVYLQGAPENIVQNISGLNNVKVVEGRLIVRTDIFASSSNEPLVLYGIPISSMLDNVKITRGRLFSGDDTNVIVLEETFDEVKIGDSVNITTPKGNSSLTLLGNCKSIWVPSFRTYHMVYGLAPLETVQSLFGMSAKINAVLFQVQNPSMLSATIDEVKNFLKDYGVISSPYEGKVVPVFEFDYYMSALTNALAMVGFLSVVVGAAFIYNILSMSVGEDYGEIGTLKVLGMTRRQVLFVYVMRGMIVGSVGSILGSILGLGLAASMLASYASFGGMFMGVTVSQLVRGVDVLAYTGLGVGLAIPGAIIPSVRAGRTVIHEAITSGYEAPKASAFRLDLSRFGIIPVSYAVGSLLRKRGRVMGLTITLALPLVLSAGVLPISYTVTANANHYWSDVYKIEGSGVLRPSVDVNTIERMKSSEGVKALEPYYIDFVQAVGFTVPLVGILPNTSMANYEMLEGRWLREGNDEIVLTSFLAARLNVHAGDNLTITTIDREAEVKVVGIVQDLIVNIICGPISFVQTMFNNTGNYNAIIVQYKQGFEHREVYDKLKKNFWQVSEFWSIIDVRTTFYSSILAPFLNVIGLVFSLSWFASIAIVGTMVAMDVRGRLKDFTTLRALGATPLQVERIIILEMFLVGVLSGGLGILLSLGFANIVINRIFTVTGTISPVFSWDISVSLWLLTILISVLSGFLVIRQAAKVSIAEALGDRYGAHVRFTLKKQKPNLCPYLARSIEWYCRAQGDTFLERSMVEKTCTQKTEWAECSYRAQRDTVKTKPHST